MSTYGARPCYITRYGEGKRERFLGLPVYIVGFYYPHSSLRLSIKHLLVLPTACGLEFSYPNPVFDSRQRNGYVIGQLDRQPSKPRGATPTKWTLYDGAGLSSFSAIIEIVGSVFECPFPLCLPPPLT